MYCFELYVNINWTIDAYMLLSVTFVMYVSYFMIAGTNSENYKTHHSKIFFLMSYVYNIVPNLPAHLHSQIRMYAAHIKYSYT